MSSAGRRAALGSESRAPCSAGESGPTPDPLSPLTSTGSGVAALDSDTCALVSLSRAMADRCTWKFGSKLMYVYLEATSAAKSTPGHVCSAHNTNLLYNVCNLLNSTLLYSYIIQYSELLLDCTL